jgi:hypothetical protein
MDIISSLKITKKTNSDHQIQQFNCLHQKQTHAYIEPYYAEHCK